MSPSTSTDHVLQAVTKKRQERAAKFKAFHGKNTNIEDPCTSPSTSTTPAKAPNKYISTDNIIFNSKISCSALAARNIESYSSEVKSDGLPTEDQDWELSPLSCQKLDVKVKTVSLRV